MAERNYKSAAEALLSGKSSGSDYSKKSSGKRGGGRNDKDGSLGVKIMGFSILGLVIVAILLGSGIIPRYSELVEVAKTAMKVCGCGVGVGLLLEWCGK